ncbi:unnamed protein product [Calypogeia fissa]
MADIVKTKALVGTGEGPSNPDPVGLPTKGKKGVSVAAKGEPTGGARTSSRAKTPAKVTVKKERVATPSQPTTSVQTSDGVVNIEVVEREPPTKVTIDVTKSGEEEDMSKIKV